VALAALLLGVALAGCAREARSPAVEEVDPGAATVRSAVGLVTGTEAQQPGRFSTTDWGLAWEDALSRHGPPPARLDPTTLRHTLAGRRVLVVTRGAQAVVGDSAIAAVGAWVEAGGRLLLEMPERRWGVWAPAWVAGAPVAASAARATWPDLAPLASPPESLAVVTVRAPLAARGPCDTLLWLDGEPAALECAVGRGRVLVLGFDLGCWLVSLQQGVPREDFSVPIDARGGGEPVLRQTDDLVAASAPPRRLVPWADRLQRALVERLEAGMGVARWRLLPGEARGLYLPSHDEEGKGDNWLYYADHERRTGWVATWFVMPRGRLTPRGYAKLAAPPLEVGAHPDLHGEDRAPTWRAGLRRLLGRERPGLAAEVESVRVRLERAGGPPLRLDRMHYLKWSAGYADRFRWLAHLGIRLDSSYGPDRGGFGYVFGTGLPFRPLDERGRVLPLWEAPFQAMDDREFEPRAVHALFANAAGSGVGIIFHTTAMAYQPRAEMMQTYLDAPAWAREEGFAVMRYGELLDFWQTRGTPLEQRWSGDTLSTSFVPPRPAPGLVLQLPLAAAGKGLSAYRLATGAWRRAGRPGGGEWVEEGWLCVPADSAAGSAEAVYRVGARWPASAQRPTPAPRLRRGRR
jgi:hypothetical protein